MRYRNASLDDLLNAWADTIENFILKNKPQWEIDYRKKVGRPVDPIEMKRYISEIDDHIYNRATLNPKIVQDMIKTYLDEFKLGKYADEFINNYRYASSYNVDYDKIAQRVASKYNGRIG